MRIRVEDVTEKGSMNEILTVEEMAKADQLTISAGTPGRVLMERAGRAVAECAGEMVQSGASILVLCGPGNNGGDGVVAARCLLGRGFAVSIGFLGDRAALRGDAALAAESWDGPVKPLSELSFAGVDLVIDALFGAGLNRPLEGRREMGWKRSRLPVFRFWPSMCLRAFRGIRVRSWGLPLRPPER